MSSKKSPKTKIIWSGFFLRLFILFLLLFLGYLILLFTTLNKNIDKAIVHSTNPENNKPSIIKNITKSIIGHNITLKGKEENRINILLLGIGGNEHKGKYLTDTIALASINPKTYQSAILSIPRDFYVKIPDSSYHTKINALYTYGIRNEKMSEKDSIQLIEKSVAEITGEKIHYYVILDFTGFKEIINILDGINIQVSNDIYDTRYPGPNNSYQTFEITKGFHKLDAETALKYARVRHTKDGDFGRAYRQQQIIASARKKALSLKILANPIKIINLMDTLGNHLKTNISPEEIPTMISLIKNVNIYQATTKVLDAWSKDSLLKSTHIPLGSVSAYVLIPKGKNYSQIQKLNANIFDLNKLEEFKEKIETEDAKITLLTSSYSSFISFKKILQEWGYHINLYHPTDYKTICSEQQDKIINYNTKKKIFTLNDLAERLDIKINYPTPTDTEKYQTDITLCITQDTVNYFTTKQEDDTTPDTLNSQKILNDAGKVLINK